jgi:hypothetical protein
MWFGVVKIGKAYVSYHLMPLEAIEELRRLTAAAADHWARQKLP